MCFFQMDKWNSMKWKISKVFFYNYLFGTNYTCIYAIDPLLGASQHSNIQHNIVHGVIKGDFTMGIKNAVQSTIYIIDIFLKIKVIQYVMGTRFF